MRIAIAASVLVVVLASSLGEGPLVVEAAKRPGGSGGRSSAPSRRSGGERSGSSGRPRGPPPQSKARRRASYKDDYDGEPEDDDDEDDLAFGFPNDDVDEYDGRAGNGEDFDSDAAYEDDEEEDERPLPPRRASGRRGPPAGPGKAGSRGGRGSPPASSRRGRAPPPRSRSEEDEEYDDDEEDYNPRRPPPRRGAGGPPPRGGRPRPGPGGRGGPGPRGRGRPSGGGGGGRRGSDRGRGSRGSVVPYTSKQAGAFSRGLSAVRASIPDASTVMSAASTSIAAAKESTTKLSSNIYREVKGLTSSELEQVMLKATSPNDAPVKGKHVERLVGVTYQISGRYDIYDSVLRKLWNKMAEKDWRTKIKALYILHRFSADGAPDHQAALKARLRELRRARDPKRKEKYFNSKQLLAGESTPENKKYFTFLSRYAHYVLLRAQCFGGMFNEISQESSAAARSSSSAKSQKPITSTALRPEHLEAATMILKAGVGCSLKDGEVCENTACCVERVVSDLIGLTTATAVALNRALKGKEAKDADPAVVQKWCEFYSEELLPQTKALMKKTSPKLDAYGLFLPSRMGASVSGELLQRGLQVAVESEGSAVGKADEATGGKEEKDAEDSADERADEAAEEEEDDQGDEEVDAEQESADDQGDGEDDDEEYDEYDYDVEEEYYDDEEA